MYSHERHTSANVDEYSAFDDTHKSVSLCPKRAPNKTIGHKPPSHAPRAHAPGPHVTSTPPTRFACHWPPSAAVHVGPGGANFSDTPWPGGCRTCHAAAPR